MNLRLLFILNLIGILNINILCADDRYDQVQELYRKVMKKFPNVKDKTINEYLILKKNNPKIVLVDTRSFEEFRVSRIPNAILIDEFLKNEAKYRDYTVIAYCTIGYRSAQFVEKILRKKFNAYNLKGSLLAWAHEVKKLVDQKNKPTQSIHVYGKKWDLAPIQFKSVY